MAITSQVLGTPLASSTDANSYTYTIAGDVFTPGRLWEIRVAGFATSPAGFTVSGRGLTWTLDGEVTQGSIRLQRFVGTGTPDASGNLTLAAVSSQIQAGCRAVLREVWDTDSGTVVTEDVVTGSAATGDTAAVTLADGESGDYLLGSVDAGAFGVPLNTSGGVAARNGTSSHTVSFGFTSTAGSLLVFICAASVTNAATGWTERHSPVQSAELSVFTKTSVGDSSITVTHNASNYPMQWWVEEWPAGTDWVNGAQASAGNTTMPNLTGLPGTPVRVSSTLARSASGTSGSLSAGSWGGTTIEDRDAITLSDGSTDGVWFAVAHGDAITAASLQPTVTVSESGSPASGSAEYQKVVFATEPYPTWDDEGPFGNGATLTHLTPALYMRYNDGDWAADGSVDVASWVVSSPWTALVAMYRIAGDESVTVNTTAARLGLRAATSEVEVGATTVDTEAAALGLRAATSTVDASTTVETIAAQLGLRAATTTVQLGVTTVDTTAARLGLRAATTTVEVGARAVDTEAARLGLRGATTTVDARTTVDTTAARLGLRAAITTIALGVTEVNTTAARLGLRSADTTVELGTTEIDTQAARLGLRAATTTVEVGAVEVDTTAASLGLRAAVTEVLAGVVRVNTTAARLGLRAAVTSVQVGAVTINTTAARLGLRSAVTDVDAGQTVVNTTAATLGLRAATTSVDVGARTVDTEAARLGLRAAHTTVETPTTTVNTSAASMGFRAGTTTVAIGPVVVNTAAATLGLRAAVTTVDTPVLRIVNTAAAVLGMRAARTTVQAFIPPVPDDESLWGRMIQLLQCAIDALNAQAFSDPMLKPAPDRAFIQPGGQVAWDDCCDCDGERCGGQLWVRVVRAHPSNPYPVKSIAVIPCADDFATQLGLGIVRCVHTMDDDGSPPTAEQLTLEAHQAVCDMAALLKAIECCSDDIDQTVVVDQWLPLGASGGCAGGEWVAYTDAPIRCAPMILEPV